MEVKQEQPKAATTSKKPTGKTPAMKREMSDIFKSFSKPKSKLTKEETGSSHGGTPAPETPQSVSFNLLEIYLGKSVNSMIRTLQATP